MTRISPVRRGALLLATLAMALGGAVGAAGPGTAVAPTHQEVAARQATAQRTTLTFEVDGCKKCRVRLTHALQGHQKVWQSREKTVRGGQVAFTFRSNRSWGMSVTVRAPWEGATGYVTTVAFRYGHEKVGAGVTLREARTKRRASGCWAGTQDTAMTLPLDVRKVRVPGTTGPTDGSIAWIPTTQAWLRPMLPARRGVLGTQDVPFCAS